MQRTARRLARLLAFILGLTAASAAADDGRVELFPDGIGLRLRVLGADDDEWWLQQSDDLVTWTNLPGRRPLFSGGDDAASMPLTGPSGPGQFYRARRTEGLYDPTRLRTIRLTFTQSNWQTLLTRGRDTGSNTVARLVLDEAVVRTGVGARYKGNTSFTMGGAKKSINLDINFTNSGARLMGFRTVNLNNAAGDETIMREPVYFNVMHRYAPSPRGGMVQLYINETNWGVYSLIEQENADLVKEWFPSNDGDRWKAPNIAGGGGGFGGAGSALSWLGPGTNSYRSNYELKTDNSTNAWTRLVNAINVLNNSPAAGFRDRVEEVLAVDRWLWFLAVENVFADDDSYFNKGADYGFYHEPESGRIHPLEHDGNEAFTAGDAQLSPVQGATGTNRPVIAKLLAVPELRQRYLAHLRTVLGESYHPAVLTPEMQRFHLLSVSNIIADPKKGYSMGSYTNDLNSLKTFVTNRYRFLTNHAELRPVPPEIVHVTGPATAPTAAEIPSVTAEVRASGTNGLDSVWLYHRGRAYGRFVAVQMLDDGQHADGGAGDGRFGAATTNYPAGTRVRFYVEARSANAAKAAAFAPARAEQEVFSYRVQVTTAPETPVVINEFMASNLTTLADPQGEFDDWIEIRNVTGVEVDLTGRHLSDEPNNPRKWPFPAGTRIAPGGHLLVWADEDTELANGLHASFKLSADGEEIFLTDTDANLNQVLDSVAFGGQQTDRSYGRTAADPAEFDFLAPTPGGANR